MGLVLVSAFDAVSTTLINRGRHSLNRGEILQATKRGTTRSRREYVASHLLLRFAVSIFYDCDPWNLSVVQTCEYCGGFHGRPWISQHPELYVSISHDYGEICAGVSNKPIGVDVQWPDPRAVLTIGGDPFQAQNEWTADVDPYRAWVRRECFIKADGHGLQNLGNLESSDETMAKIKSWSVIDWVSPQGSLGSAIAQENIDVGVVQRDGTIMPLNRSDGWQVV